MAESDAERARRSRRHRAGDHGLCTPRRCTVARGEAQSSAERNVTEGVTTLPGVTARAGLGPSGQTLWDGVTGGFTLDALHRPVLLEACRITDRLDTLARQLEGHDWLRFRHNSEDGTEVTVYVDRVLSEAREQATALKGLLVQLDRALLAKKAPKGERNVLADLSQRIAERRAASAPGTDQPPAS